MRRIVFSLLLAVGCSTTCLAEDAGAGKQPAYMPGPGDLMTMTVQPRHIKLGLAGQARNWPYAAYEFGELQEALDELAELMPTWDGKPLATMLHSATDAPLKALEAAIKAQDASGFYKAYGQLTAGCNQCHHNAGKPEIVIRVPKTSPYPDQDFRAAARP